MPQNRYLEEMQDGDRDKQEGYKKLCQLRGTVLHEVEEVNDLGETKLMAAAADGRSWSPDFFCMYILKGVKKGG